jgi:hypothetical protein
VFGGVAEVSNLAMLAECAGGVAVIVNGIMQDAFTATSQLTRWLYGGEPRRHGE